MKYENITGSDFKRHLEAVIEIDRITLPSIYVTTIEKLRERFLSFEDSFVGVLADNALVGYINFFPIQEKTLYQMLDGQIKNDIELGNTDVLDSFPNKPFDVYIITVAVMPDFQNGVIIRSLVASFRAKVKEWKIMAPEFRAIYASAVSEDGEQFLKRLGFAELQDNKGLFKVDVEHFLDSI